MHSLKQIVVKPSLFISVAMSLLFCSSPLSARDTDPAKKLTLFSPDDIFELEVATDPQMSPDGKLVAYVRRSNDIMSDSTRSSIWVADPKGKSHRPLLSSNHNYYAPRFSPDGTRIAYISNKDSGHSGAPQIYVRWLDTGQTALITNLASSPSSLIWSADGQHLAFTMSVKSSEKPFTVDMPEKPKGAKWADGFEYVTKARYQADGRGILEPAYTHIFIVPSDGGTARQLSSGNYHHRGQLSFAPDSQLIYFSSNRSENYEYEPGESDIFSIDMRGKITQITDAPGMESDPVVSPNGKLIAYSKRDNKKLAYRNRYLHVIDADGSNDRNITKDIDNSVSNFHWKNNRGLYLQQTVRGVTQVDFVSLKGNVQSVVTGLGGLSLGRPYTSGDFSYSNGVVAFTKGATDRPADIYALKDGKEYRVTSLNEDIFAHKTFGKVEEFTYNSSIDQEEIHGWYILPPNYDSSKKYPLILEIHGGPHLAYGPVFTAELQRMAAEGYIVFYNNHRGSTGYGERFALLLQNKYSSKYDFADHMSGVDALIQRGLVDEDQLFITGGSAGGIATAYAIGLTDRFKAAVVAKPVINWVSKVLTADSYLYQIPFQFPGLPWDHLEHYWKRSPLSLVGNVTTPTMLLTGVNDRRTPMSETEQFYQALKLQKVDTVMVRVPGASHGIAVRPSHLVGKIENILAWFEKYKE